jgi:potassium-transporting ATPase potassium-binding subunit
MTIGALVQLSGFLIVLFTLAYPLGIYIAGVVRGDARIVYWMRPLETFIYRLSGVDSDYEMTWREYAIHLLVFSVLGIVMLFLLQRFQAGLPLNPEGLPSVSSDSSFNTAISFVTNTNWQGYAGESTLSYLSQMLGLTVQNFVSASSGMAVLFALVRGFTRLNTSTIGNFWVDLTRSTLYLLLPVALVLSTWLVEQGVVQSFSPYQTIETVEDLSHANDLTRGSVQDRARAASKQRIPLGPVASQIAIKQLGTNGGGYFNTNSAHPFENPTPLSDFLELVAILLIPAALCFSFGSLVGDPRQGYALVGSMTLVLVALAVGEITAEQAGNPLLGALGIDTQVSMLQSGGNMEGKETRFGIVASSLWGVATTAASNGSVNAMLDSFTPLGGLIPLWLIQLGEVIFGGVGSGLYGMVVFAMVAVFIAGLMIGRTPEYLGKKIEAFEMKMAALVILIPPFLVLLGSAVSVLVEPGRGAVANPGAHGFTEILYAFSSAGNNNGSAFAGISANTPYYNVVLGLVMFLGRFWVAIPVLAIAGSLAQKKIIPAGPGTLPTHNALFVILLIATVLVVGALTFIPALALGPVVEHLMLFNSVTGP